MKAGFAQVDFTPLEGYMPGEFYPFYAFSTRCPLFASAAALTSGDETVILISVDVLSVERETAAVMREQISKATGVPVSHIIIAATHTHTGSSDHRVSGLCPAEPDTGAYTAKCIVEAGIAAWNDRREGAKIGAGRGEEKRMSFNRDCILDDGTIKSIPGAAAKDRIVGYLGKVDYDVFVMRIDGADGKPQGFIVNYANHPDNNNTSRTRFSADFPGYLRQNLKAAYGEDVTVLFLNGACGDVNAYNYKSGVSEPYASKNTYMPEEMGKLLFETVDGINKTVDATEAEPEIAAVSRLFTVKRRVPAEWEAAKAREALAKVAAGQRLPRVTLLKSRQIAAYNPYDADTTDFEMIAMRIGPWAIVTAPGELYTEIGLRIKAASPFENTLICEQANDRAGYIVPDNVLGTTAYGGAYPSGRLGYGTADVMVNGAQDMLKTFKA